MKKLALLAIVVVVAGCGTVTTTATETAVRPTILPVQVFVASTPVQQETKEFPTAVVAKKFQSCTSALGPKVNTAQTNQAFRNLPSAAQRFLTNGIIGSSTIAPPMEMRSACGGDPCRPRVPMNRVNVQGPKLQK